MWAAIAAVASAVVAFGTAVWRISVLRSDNKLLRAELASKKAALADALLKYASTRDRLKAITNEYEKLLEKHLKDLSVAELIDLDRKLFGDGEEENN